MADETKNPREPRWTAEKIIIFLTALSGLLVSTWNNLKIGTVQSTQTIHGEATKANAEKIESILYIPPEKRAALATSEPKK